MAINESLLIAAPMLQDYLVDKDTGLPLAAGVVTLYTNFTNMFLKPWYTQQGDSLPYTYVELPNPMVLSAVGTIQDTSGNDVIPFFYPYTQGDAPEFESYFITVENSNGELQFTRANFPFVAKVNPPASLVATNENLLINNCFWRNAALTTNTPFNPNTTAFFNGKITINAKNLIYGTLAPSQHDGHIMPDILYFKDTMDSVETISFNTFSAPSTQTTFPDNVLLPNDITPELYFNLTCATMGTETVRYVQIPLQLHIKSLSGFAGGYFTIEAYNAAFSNAVITAAIFQFTGTGAPIQPVVSTQQIILGSGWNKSTINLPIPTAQTLTTGVGGDDALYIQIGYPTQQVFNINIALPEFYLGSPPATNSFQTYDQVNAIASSPRTGDVRTSLNKFSPYGWVPANDGTIGSSLSTATTRNSNDTWLLYNLIYTSMSDDLAPVTGGRTAPGNTTAAAYTDFAANKAMALTKNLGRAMIGLPPLATVTYDRTITPTWNNSVTSNPAGTNYVGVFTITLSTTTALLYPGSPIYLTGTMPTGGNFVANKVYYAIPARDGTATQFQLATTYDLAIAGTAIQAGAATDNGSNLVLNYALGGAFGQKAHKQIENELATHSHPGSVAHTETVPNAGGALLIFSQKAITGFDATLAIAPDGLSYPFNVVPPSTYMNVFFKL